MPFSLSKKNPFLFIASFLIILVVSFFSCQRELTGDADYFQAIPDFTTKVNTSVSGFVTDDKDAALSGAVVNAGGSSIVTDKYGFFEIKNIQAPKEAAFVTVTSPGYFKGIKTWLATEGKSSFFRIKLIPKTITGNIDAVTGGTMRLTNGLIISLPSNAVVNAATNANYTGKVNVAAKWIDPTAADLSRTMPGDLRGLDTAGKIRMLSTYGMAAVELTGQGGELLQITSGKKAIITIPLPASMTASAPYVIPLWYFDETLGLWQQQGNAVKTGSSYIGEVSHFSYWNCDVPSNYVRFNCTITDAKGIPVQYARVKVSVAGNSQSAGEGYTDSSGYTGGAIPNNAQLLLQVFNDYNCATVLYAQNFTTTNVNLSLGKITIAPATSTVATITGKVVNCSNAAVTNGFVMMMKDGINYHYNVDNTGSFNFSSTLCSNNTVVTFIAEDISTNQSGKSFTDTLATGANAIGTLTACGTSTQQFINYTINGTSYSVDSTAASSAQGVNIWVTGYSLAANNRNNTSIYFYQTGTAVNSKQALQGFTTPTMDSTSILTPINVNITEYGAVGQFLAGNFTGTFTGQPPLNTPYNVTCSFRVRRGQ